MRRVCGTALLAALAAIPGQTANETQKLPDGSVLTLRRVTYGSKAQFTNAKWVEQQLPAQVPARARVVVAMGVGAALAQSPDGLVFWFSRTGGGAPPFLISSVDEHGCEIQQGQRLSWVLDAKGEALDAYLLSAFPRRGKAVALRLWTNAPTGSTTPSFEWRAPNPATRAAASWPADPLPGTQRNGDLELTLKRVLTHVDSRLQLREADSGARWSTRLEFDLREKGQATDAWAVDRVELRDAGGNVLPAPLAVQQYGKLAHVWGGLCPAETWKIRLAMRRRGAFPAAETVTLSGVPVPGVAESLAQNRKITGPGLNAVLNQVTGPKGKPKEGPALPGQTTVRVSAALPADARLTLVKAEDDQGRSVLAAPNEMGVSEQHLFGLRVPEGARKLNLTFALQRARVLEFRVKPARLKGG